MDWTSMVNASPEAKTVWMITTSLLPQMILGLVMVIWVLGVAIKAMRKPLM